MQKMTPEQRRERLNKYMNWEKVHIHLDGGARFSFYRKSDDRCEGLLDDLGVRHQTRRIIISRLSGRDMDVLDAWSGWKGSAT